VARWSRTFRRRLGAGAAGLAIAAVAVGCGTLTPANGPDGGSGSAEQIVVCESGPVTQGDVHTSSAVATRVPAGTAVPPGCRLG